MAQAALQLQPGVNHSGSLDSIIPFQMPNGFLIKQMSDLCVTCNHEIEAQDWTVDVSWLGQTCAVFKMEAQCPHCGGGEARNMRFRIHADGRLDMDECKNGAPWNIFKNLPRASDVEVKQARSGLLDKFLDALRGGW